MSSDLQLKEKVRYNKNLVSYSVEELEYLTKPFGYANFLKDGKPEKNNPNANDKKKKYQGLTDTLNLADNPEYIKCAKVSKGIKDEVEEVEEVEESDTYKDTDYMVPPRPLRTKPAHWSDRIKCKTCGKIFYRSNRSKHNESRYHLSMQQIGEKLLQIIRPDFIDF